jgi:hypothetical protein|uniref:Uncharacterized protein n=1 Tax=viral metagenome TaxID=1070528 RepID=A0A6C0CWW3_9ZZZZ
MKNKREINKIEVSFPKNLNSSFYKMTSKLTLRLPKISEHMETVSKGELLKIYNGLAIDFTYKSGKKGKKQIFVSEIDEIYNIKLHQCIIAGPKIGKKNKKEDYIIISFSLNKEKWSLNIPLEKFNELKN